MAIGLGILIFEFCMAYILLKIEKYHNSKEVPNKEEKIESKESV